MKKLIVPACCAALLTACGGGSGVEEDRVLSTLNADDRIKVCEYALSQVPPVGEYTCVGGNIEIEADDLQVSSCVSGDFFDDGQPLCTVGVFEACFAEIGSAGSPCAINATDECRVLQEFCDGGTSVSRPPQVGDVSPPDSGSGSDGSSSGPGDG